LGYINKLESIEIGKGEPEVNSNKNLYSTSNTFLYTKLLIPRLPVDCLCRELLLAKLDEITKKKLTLVTAPAGYGKTMLVSMWLSKQTEAVKSCWVSLDEHDNNAQLFWHYIIMSVNRAATGYLDGNATISPLMPVDSFEIMLNGLINWLSGIHYDIVLVIDDYHLIHDESIHKSMQYFVSHIPDNIHIVIISRIIPPIKFARLRLHGKLLELKAEELKLTLNEVTEFLVGNMKLCLVENEVKKLEEYTEGWIAALNLTALSIKSSSNMKEYLGNLSHMNEYVVEYMSEEVFNLLEADIKDFLVKTSILDTLNGSLCDEVAGISNSKEIICCLEKNNVFINVLDDEKLNYRYHSLFAEFLRNRLMKISTDKVEELYLNASRWYEKSNMIQETLEYSIRSNNHRNTARLIEKFGEIMIINRDLVRLADIIEVLPGYLIRNSAKICALYTMTVAGKNASGNKGVYIGDLFISFNENVFNESREELLLIRTMLAYANEDFKTALEYGNQMLENLSEEGGYKCLFYKILMQVYSVIGDSEKCKHCLDLYIDAVRKKNYFDEFFIDISYIHIMVHIQCGVGKYTHALQLLIKFQERLNSYNILLPAMANCIYLDLGYLYYEFGELELSRSNVDKCIEISSIKMDFFRLISAYILIARISQKRGEYDIMIKFIKKVDDLCDKYNAKLIMNNLIAYIVRALLSAGEMEYAEYLIRKYEIKVQNSYDVLYEEVHLALADLYIVKGEFCKAEEILEKLYKEVIGTKRNLSYVKIMILKSLLLKCNGNETEAVKYMKDAIERASEQKYINTFADFGVPVAEIICKVLTRKEETGLANGKDIDYASCILSYIKEPEDQLGSADPEMLRSLTRREMEVLNYIFSGFTNKEIAAKLFVAESTIKKHINNIYGKIGVTNRAQVICFYRKFAKYKTIRA